VWDFLRADDDDRLPILQRVLDAVVMARRARLQVVMLAESVDQGALWVGAASLLAPAGWAHGLTFSTYERLSALPAGRHPVLCVTPTWEGETSMGRVGALRAVPEGWLVVDAQTPPSGDGDAWLDERGLKVPRSLWARVVPFALDVSFVDVETVLSRVRASALAPGEALQNALLGSERHSAVHEQIRGMSAGDGRAGPTVVDRRLAPASPYIGPRTVESALSDDLADLAGHRLMDWAAFPGIDRRAHAQPTAGAALAAYLDAVATNQRWRTVPTLHAPVVPLTSRDSGTAEVRAAERRLLEAAAREPHGDTAWSLRVVDLLVRCGSLAGSASEAQQAMVGAVMDVVVARLFSPDGENLARAVPTLHPETALRYLSPQLPADALPGSASPPVVRWLRDTVPSFSSHAPAPTVRPPSSAPADDTRWPHHDAFWTETDGSVKVLDDFLHAGIVASARPVDIALAVLHQCFLASIDPPSPHLRQLRPTESARVRHLLTPGAAKAHHLLKQLGAASPHGVERVVRLLALAANADLPHHAAHSAAAFLVDELPNTASPRTCPGTVGELVVVGLLRGATGRSQPPQRPQELAPARWHELQAWATQPPTTDRVFVKGGRS
jgi:hypothetical protein